MAQANIKDVDLMDSWFSITLAETKLELEATKRVNFLLAFKCIILQYKGQKNQLFLDFFFPKIEP